ncbi:hypothetical protein FA13DRAFT_101608 [Coprinellus micaceus]|uniref:Uncharacterized protein n=1 Tax=Coprinellus micaceus TaxID=71717 RepID=A0A4Y7SJU4_COPMI|nr:hypothetical protein FA13DRAFT_101608 [Coprinellus micaceus]
MSFSKRRRGLDDQTPRYPTLSLCLYGGPEIQCYGWLARRHGHQQFASRLPVGMCIISSRNCSGSREIPYRNGN